MKHKPTTGEGGESSDSDMRDDYDFSDGVQGKYAERLREGSNLIRLDQDVAALFPDSESVNRALRKIAEVAQSIPLENRREAG